MAGKHASANASFFDKIYDKAKEMAAPIIDKYEVQKEKRYALKQFHENWDKIAQIRGLGSQYNENYKEIFDEFITEALKSADIPKDVYDPQKMTLAKLELVDEFTIRMHRNVVQDPVHGGAKIEAYMEMFDHSTKMIDSVDRFNRHTIIDITENPEAKAPGYEVSFGSVNAQQRTDFNGEKSGTVTAVRQKRALQDLLNDAENRQKNQSQNRNPAKERDAISLNFSR